jgi:hypothetical protein
MDGDLVASSQQVDFEDGTTAKVVGIIMDMLRIS